jgi:hypothetical protein
MDAFAFELLGGPDAFPGRGDLDQHALAADAGQFIKLDQPARLDQFGLGVEVRRPRSSA